MNMRQPDVKNSYPNLGQPFVSAEAAWFWAVAGIEARRDGASFVPGRGGGAIRPCDPDDVVMAAERLYAAGRLRRAHLIVLAEFGLRQSPPSRRHPGDVAAYRFWHEAMKYLAPLLRAKGIVA